ncbi:hypothetical protein F5148DRAFT_158547 [Russula earlei]|uniref:Uncharacterized protein n=1 Tax=Russula earlei TaxID=71964 RepID=A0ACC0U6H3_9AGAM|nr:hypothetical protein F5148DRAFT_158547 [Russula earlei]
MRRGSEAQRCVPALVPVALILCQICKSYSCQCHTFHSTLHWHACQSSGRTQTSTTPPATVKCVAFCLPLTRGQTFIRVVIPSERLDLDTFSLFDLFPVPLSRNVGLQPFLVNLRAGRCRSYERH